MNLKKLVIFLLVAAMSLGMFACAPKTEGTAAPATEAPKVDATQAPAAATEAPKAQSGIDVAEIIVGHYGPLTGAVSTSGQAGQKGAELKVKQVNAAGGINGVPVRYIPYDDKSNAEGAVKAVTRFIEEDKVHGLIGSQLSGNIQASGDRVEKAGIPEVGTGISPVWLQQGWKYLFRALANSSGGVVPIVDAMEKLGVKKIATLVYQDEGSRVGANMVFEEMEKRNITITAKEVFQPNDTDWTGQFSKMINSKPDAMMIFAQGEQQGTLMKQLRSMGYKGYVFGQEAASLPDVRKVAGDAANGLIFYAPHCIPDAVEEANTEQERAFLEAYIAEYGAMPVSDVAYRCYDAMTILLKGFEIADSVDGDKVRDAIKNIKGLELLAGTADYTQFDNGECMSGFKVYITHNGKNILFENFIKDNPLDTYKAN